MVVLVSNHGEELGEHNLFSHGVHYDTVLHIPLFVYDPRRGDNSGQRVTTMVQGIDVAPTVLALAGVTHDETMDGQSLVPLMDGEPELYATGPAFSLSDSLTASMHTPESKLYAHPFRAPPPPKPTKRPNLSGPARLVGELYRLDEDPGETNDLALTEPDWVQTAWQQLEPWLEARTRDDGSQQTPHVAHDQRMADRLRADGY